MIEYQQGEKRLIVLERKDGYVLCEIRRPDGASIYKVPEPIFELRLKAWGWKRVEEVEK